MPSPYVYRFTTRVVGQDGGDDSLHQLQFRGGLDTFSKFWYGRGFKLKESCGVLAARVDRFRGNTTDNTQFVFGQQPDCISTPCDVRGAATKLDRINGGLRVYVKLFRVMKEDE